MGSMAKGLFFVMAFVCQLELPLQINAVFEQVDCFCADEFDFVIMLCESKHQRGPDSDGRHAAVSQVSLVCLRPSTASSTLDQNEPFGLQLARLARWRRLKDLRPIGPIRRS